MAARPPAGQGVLAALLVAALLAGGSSAGAAAAPVALAAAGARVPAERYFSLDGPVAFADNAKSQSLPQPLLNASGELAVAYIEGFYTYGGQPTFSTFDSGTGAPVQGPVQVTSSTFYDPWGNTTARGQLAALDGAGRLVQLVESYGFPNETVTLKVVDLAGATRVPETAVGSTPYYGGAAAVAVGANDSVFVLRYDTAARYSKMAANGTWAYRNVTVFNGTSSAYPPQLAFDAPAGLMLVSWEVRGGGGRVMALTDNGSVAWGPVTVGSGEANLSVAPTADGGVVGVYAEGGTVHAFKLDAGGLVVAADRTVVATAPSARTPRPTPLAGGEVAVVWSDKASGGNFDVRAMALNGSDLSVTIAPVDVSSDAASSVNARGAAAPDGSLWVAWQNDSTAYTASLLGARLTPRWSGFALDAPSQAVTAYRGEPTVVRIGLASLVPEAAQLDLTTSVAPWGGPSNWSAGLWDDAGVAVGNLSLGAFGSASVSLRMDGPVVDPAGYGAWVWVTATDRHRQSAAGQLFLNVTVVQGHRFAVSPADQNATAMPAEPVSLNFEARNAGALEESGVPAFLTAQPPGGGWSALLAPGSFSGPPGSTVNFTLTVTPPPGALSGDAFCTRFKVQHPDDPFSLATAGFCVRVGLVAQPRIDPAFASLLIDPGTTVPQAFTVENVGNAGQPIDCTVALEDALPTGWAVAGNPAVAALRGGESAPLTLAFTAPSGALGDFLQNLTLGAVCEGSAAGAKSHILVAVRPIRAVAWSTPGNSVDADANLEARLNITVQNDGNLGETVALQQVEAPPGWSVAGALRVGGSSALQVAPFGTGVFTLTIAAPAASASGGYLVNVSLVAGSGASYQVSYTVRIPKTYGLATNFTPDAALLGASERLQVVAQVASLGNTVDTYSVHVLVASDKVWVWEASFAPASGTGGTYSAGALTLEPFATGTLTVNITVPREPYPGNYTLAVRLTSARAPEVDFNVAARVTLPQLAVRVESAPQGAADPRLEGALTVVVENRGERAAAAPVLLVTVDGERAALLNLSDLAPGEARTLRVNVSVAPGGHTAEAFIDPTTLPGASPLFGAIFESDETDNAASLAFSVGGPEAPGAAGTAGPFSTGGEGGAVTTLAAVLLGGAGAAFAFVAVARRRRRAE